MGLLQGSRAEGGAPTPSKPGLAEGRQDPIRPDARRMGAFVARRISNAFSDLSAVQGVGFDLKRGEAALLGGAVAAGAAPDFACAMSAMSGRSQSVRPEASQRAFHLRKHRVFRQRQRDYETHRDLMHGGEK